MYSAYVQKGVERGHRPELIGGGLIRSAGGWAAVKDLRRTNARLKGDERILGDSDFVESVIEEQKEHLARRHHLQARGVDFDKVVGRVAEIFRLKPEKVQNNGKRPQQVKARSLLSYWAVKELEMSGVQIARKLKIGNSAVSRSVVRGEKIATDMKLKLNLD